jgi:cytochrome c peroxidase
LGKRLFSEPLLSAGGVYSCASCHQPERHFTDGRPRAIGAGGATLVHNTPTLYYAGFSSSLGWQANGALTLEQQHQTPLFSNSPLEMGFSEENLAELSLDDNYLQQFAAAFPDDDISNTSVIRALASYVRTIVPAPSAFDAYLFDDDQQALSAMAVAGMKLFFSPRLGCSNCHASLAFSGPISHVLQQTPPAFHATGVGASGAAFRAPTLRRVADTAPYMHDGSMATLQQVLQHYQNVTAKHVPKFTLSADEQGQVIAFLRTL